MRSGQTVGFFTVEALKLKKSRLNFWSPLHPFVALLDAALLILALYTYGQTRRGKFGHGEGYIWLVIWLLVGVFATFPSALAPISHFLGVELPVDLMLGIFSVFLLFAVFRLEQRLDELQRVVLKLVQERSAQELIGRSTDEGREER